MLIFEHSRPSRVNTAQLPRNAEAVDDIPQTYLRSSAMPLPEVSEMQVVRHYTRLSQKNFSIDTQFYPLGSCTMKYNPRGCNSLAMLPGFAQRHPNSPDNLSQGYLACMFELQEMLKDVTGMKGVSLAPMAGAQGEFAGVAMIRAYHDARGDNERSEILVPDAAHGTNPATAVMCGYTVREIPTDKNGDVDLEKLREAVGPQTAGIMLTNPSTGAGPVGVSERLLPYLPVPIVDQDGDEYRLLDEHDRPQTMGHLSAFMGNAGVLLRAYIYARILGREGMVRVAEYATLNANYMMARLKQAGFDIAYPQRRATHEFILTLKKQARELHVTAMDFAKRLLDYGFHAPTTYFPLLVPECLLIEPTETEAREELDGFIDAMTAILNESTTTPETVTAAPHTMPVRRLDDVKAAKELNLVWKG
ncbi:MAG: glycine dehydrogenase subunit 2 [Gammaproteobacteria bacterium]